MRTPIAGTSVARVGHAGAHEARTPRGRSVPIAAPFELRPDRGSTPPTTARTPADPPPRVERAAEPS